MRTFQAGCAIAALGIVTACGPSTELTAVWRTPDTIGPRFQKVLVVAQAPQESVRRTVENALVRNIPRGVASFSALGGIDVKDTERARAKIASDGFDGAVVVRFVGVDRQTSYVPGTAYWGPAPYGSLWGYWAYGWVGAYDPGYMKTENVISLESNVYAVSTEKLLWSSRSESVSPVSVDSMIDDLVAATIREMKKQGVL
jgi:hypothetical protein